MNGQLFFEHIYNPPFVDPLKLRYAAKLDRKNQRINGSQHRGITTTWDTNKVKFGLIDNIVELTPKEKIVAIKAVSLAEEYLGDHFPTFPVMPGVLMLEALTEAAGWLVRDALDFAPSIILLREARNVTYKSFVKPGQLLRLEVTCRRLTQDDSEFDGIGYCNSKEVVKARFGLTHFCPGKDGRAKSTVDQSLREAARATFSILRG